MPLSVVVPSPAHLAFVVSQLYLLNGALLAAARRTPAGASRWVKDHATG